MYLAVPISGTELPEPLEFSDLSYKGVFCYVNGVPLENP